ncbi:GNAT family N-acetyltransferase [Paenibacillus sp. GCM10027627]|uniref:GNAT family N-acetyltransferase n=1 Tax=unclassified Paenibacillus TaxID=185978 RepID=UPI00362DF6BF
MRMDGERIAVRAVQLKDASSLLELEAANRDFFQSFTGLRDDSFYTVQGQEERIRELHKLAEDDRGYFYLVCLKQTDAVIGEVILSEVVRDNLQGCWIGYFLDREHNGKGYMTEAVKLVVRHAFEQLGLHRIEAGVMPHNGASTQVLLKAGFAKEGISRKNVKINGNWEDHQLLAIIEDDLREK